MSIVVAEGIVAVEADATGVGKQIADDIEKGSAQAENSGKSIGKSVFGGVVGAWAAIGGTQAVVGWFAGAVSGASDLNETMSKSSAIFGENAGTIEAWSANAAKTLGLSQSAAMNAAAGFGDMFSQIGFTGEAAAKMSTSVVQAAADLGSFSNLETADVADRISAAFRGEYDSLQAVIPNINAARVESEAMAATGKKTAAELTAQEKATAVLAIVQKDGARAMGDFARTSDGAANSAKIATASLEDQQAKLGAVLLPAWSGFLGFVNGSVVPMFSTLVGWISENTELIGGVALALGIGAGAWLVMTGAVGAYNGIMGIMKAVTVAGSVAQWALNSALLANPIGLVIGLVAALVAGIVWVATQTTFFQDTWTNVTNAVGIAWQWLLDSVVAPVSQGIGAAIQWVSDAITWVGDAWNTGVNAIGAGFQWLYDSVISPVATAIGDAFTWVLNTIIMPIVTGVMIYIGLWAGVITWLYESVISPVLGLIGAGFSWLWDSVISVVVGFVTNAITGWGMVFDWLYNSVIMPAINGIGALFTWIGTTIISPIVAFISSAVTGFGMVVNWLWTSAISPALNAIGAAFMWVWNGVISGVVSAIQGGIRAFGAVVSWLQVSIVQPVMSAVGAAFSWVWGSVISPVISFISGAINNVGTTMRNVFGGMGSFIGSAFTAVLGAIKGPINGVIGLVNGAINAVNKISVTIPAWVPLVGGQTFGLSIPRIPMLARGALNSPDTFIAGEEGPELITGRAGSRVFPARDTARILNGDDDRKIEVNLSQQIYATDPILGARQAAREVTRYLGV